MLNLKSGMKITKNNIRDLLKIYMEDNDLGFININASMSMDRTKVILCITEDEQNDEL
jgi:hypothetical protein